MGRKNLIYCGIDWAEKTHDVALVDDTGRLLAKRHITDDAVGYKILVDLLAEYGDTEENPIPVAIETFRGLLVTVLRTGKRQVFAINPMGAARYRDRHSVSRKKSDPGDALVVANILRTDMHAHRPLPNDSDLARAVAVLARAQQVATWNRQQIANQLRSLLREYYPSALAAADGWKNGLCRPEVREALRAAPTPTRAARLTRTHLQAALTADAFQGPASAARYVLAGEVQEPPVDPGVGGGVGAGKDGADRADGCGGEGIPVGVDADDAVDLFCERGHAVALLQDGRPWSASAWVESPRGGTVMSHAVLRRTSC